MILNDYFHVRFISLTCSDVYLIIDFTRIFHHCYAAFVRKIVSELLRIVCLHHISNPSSKVFEENPFPMCNDVINKAIVSSNILTDNTIG